MNTDSYSTSHNIFFVPGRSYSVNSSRLGHNLNREYQLFVHGYHSAVDAQELTATEMTPVNPRSKGMSLQMS
jgi:hypothetical protein